jgi:hypothetical protein
LQCQRTAERKEHHQRDSGYATQDWNREKMTYQKFNPPGNIPFAARNKSIGKQFHPDLNLSADGFDVWWKKTFAQHAAVVAQASALMRAHRRVSSVGEARIEQAH